MHQDFITVDVASLVLRALWKHIDLCVVMVQHVCEPLRHKPFRSKHFRGLNIKSHSPPEDWAAWPLGSLGYTRTWVNKPEKSSLNFKLIP